jgi:peptidoglycan/LPS O-acetylase OafA/YrhL
MQFRNDINGLRAIAVIAVVLFHFNSSWMPGGFAGVDVFFVISGFLMTGIIFRGIEKENFSILKFYVARANRIIPALAVLCLVLLVFGFFYIKPQDYNVLGKHVGSSMGFLSNITYWKESGYFDTSSREKWLLHTWSLSAEWQFYIIYPIVLVAMRKFMSVNAMKATVLLGTVLGFIFCVIATYKWPSPSYYLLPTRAWEMMLGGVAYLYPFILQDKRKKILEWVGLALVVGSYFLISKENPWPGYLAILPVLGTFLIIQAQRNDSLITSNAVLQKLGIWSYSIYLWHWPLVVAIYYFSLNDMFIYLGVALSVLFGFLSNKYIEKIKLRNDFGNIFTYLKCKPVYMVVVLSVMGGASFITNGFDYRYSQSQRDIITNRSIANSIRTKEYLVDYVNMKGQFRPSNSRYVDDYKKAFYCTLDNHTHTKEDIMNCLDYHLDADGFLLIGDSHSRDFYHVFKMAYPDVNIAALIHSGCVPTNYGSCFKVTKELTLKDIINHYIKENKVKGIIFASLYEAEGKIIDKFIKEAVEYSDSIGSNIYIVNAGPYNVHLADRYVKNNNGYFSSSNTNNNKKITINKKLNELGKIGSVTVIDKYSAFCNELTCLLLDGLTPLFVDSGHLSVNGYTFWASKLPNEDPFKLNKE